jgi:hypothetical protein
MNSGYLIRKIGVFIIWILKGFKGSFQEIENRHYKYDFIIGFIFLCIIAYLTMLLVGSNK